MRAFGFYITSFVIGLAQQVVFAAPDLSELGIDGFVLLSEYCCQ